MRKLAVFLLAAFAVSLAPHAPAQEPDEAALAEEVCGAVGHDLLLRVWRGTRLDRSGDIQILAREPNFVDGGLTHAGPWDYLQRVPVFFYGPGYVKPGTFERPITLADVAPTTGALLGFDFPAPDGGVVADILEPDRPTPKLVVTLVWDSAGIDVLETWPDDWPFLATLIPEGAWFENAIVGASPSNTPVAHATIGTGAFPNRHGFNDEFIFVNNRIEKPNENGPGFLLAPTLADLYDRAMDNEPVVGAVATLAAHIGMMSHGLQWGGGDNDIAITREKEFAEKGGEEDVEWNLTSDMEPFYRLPKYANEIGGFEDDIRRLDQADGALDGYWRDNSIQALKNGFDTPARTPLQTRLIEEVIRREHFGRDGVPDLLYLNYKAIDTVGHLFSADGIEMSDTVRIQDDALRELVGFLDREIGRGEWAMLLLADHGTNRNPTLSGAFRIGIDQVEAKVAEAFDADGDAVPLIQKIRPTQMWLDDAELAENGFTEVDVARFVAGLTQADTAKPSLSIQPGKAAERVFASAFPSSILAALPCLPEARGSAS